MTADATLSVERDIYGSYWADGSENIADLTSQNFEIDSAVVDPETRFDLHYHSKDQLAWMPGGAMELTVSGTRWHLRRDRFAWIPAGTLHEMYRANVMPSSSSARNTIQCVSSVSVSNAKNTRWAMAYIWSRTWDESSVLRRARAGASRSSNAARCISAFRRTPPVRATSNDGRNRR